MLEIANLSVSYGDLQILHDISLEVKQNEIVALVGANGAGKSTTLKSISRLLEPKSGSIHFLGQDIVGIQPHKIIDLGIIHVPEGRRLFAEMTVRENLIMGALSKRARPERKRQEGNSLYDRTSCSKLRTDPGRCLCLMQCDSRCQNRPTSRCAQLWCLGLSAIEYFQGLRFALPRW